MKKFLKVFFSILGLILLATGLFIAGFWLKYRSIVDVSTQKIPKGISSAYPLSSQVNPFIGTGGVPWTCANNFPGVSLPFGVLRLSPETSSFLSNDNESHIYNTLKNIFTSSDKKEKKAMPAGRQESSALSKREETVVRCIALGMTNKEIAEHLFISVHTVIAHRKNITRKLAIKTVSGLTVYAILNKLVKFEEIE